MREGRGVGLRFWQGRGPQEELLVTYHFSFLSFYFRPEQAGEGRQAAISAKSNCSPERAPLHSDRGFSKMFRSTR